MMDAKRKAFVFLALAFLLAIVSAGLILNEIRNAQMALGETIRVAVAKTDIPAYSAMSPEWVEWVEIPRNKKLSSFIESTEELKQSVLIVNVKEGDLLTKNMLRSRVDIPADHRVVWLNVTKNVVIDQDVMEGDLVDIIAAYQDKGVLTTKRVLTAIPVVQRQQLDKDGEKLAIKVSLNVEQAEQLIHLQNTAQQIRALRVNQIDEQKLAGK